MKRFVFVLCLFVFFVALPFTVSARDGASVWSVTQNPEAPWRLFKTGMWQSFLQLNTSDGTLFLIQFDGNTGKWSAGAVLNDADLSPDGGRTPGRFTLYPTEYSFSFLLLDQMRGTCWLVQWSPEGKSGSVSLIPTPAR